MDAATPDGIAPNAGHVRVHHGETGIILLCGHGGQIFPKPFLATTALDKFQLAALEDVGTLALVTPLSQSAHTIVAQLVARAVVDVNRAPDEIDPKLLAPSERLHLPAASGRALAGLGVVPRQNGRGGAIYKKPIGKAAHDALISSYHAPFHGAVTDALERILARHNTAILLDIHSMPPEASDADLVIGTRFGATAPKDLVAKICTLAHAHGLIVALDDPFAGGYNVAHYGQMPHVHAVQLEWNRRLFCDMPGRTRAEKIDKVRAMLSDMIAAVSGHGLDSAG